MSEEREEPSLQGGNYEVLRSRLSQSGQSLLEAAESLNQQRQDCFGSTQLVPLASERVRTEHHCVPADLLQVGDQLLLGYNVVMGLKQEVHVHHVFSLHSMTQSGEGFEFEHAPAEGSFLDDPSFVRHFKDLYTYGKGIELIQLRKTTDKLLAVFKTGPSERDQVVFRWALVSDEAPRYIDNRGVEDHVFPPSHDFQWEDTQRKDQVRGPHAHISILDTIFVETVGGDLTVKIENNTQTGEGIYSEPVEDPSQSLSDAQIQYASVGSLILLRIRPYREPDWRHLVFNRQTETVTRVDALGQACIQLPEDHGIIFPGGIYLQTGEHKLFEGETTDLVFKRMLRSPNGEDVLYVFHRARDGHYVLFAYNLIRKEVQTPIHCHGYALQDDGKMIVFRAEDDPTRVHPMRVWQTPFQSAEFVQAQPRGGSPLERLGNPELVRGISDLLTLGSMARSETVSRARYAELAKACTRAIDAYPWLAQQDFGAPLPMLQQLRRTAESILDEYEKVLTQQSLAQDALDQARRSQEELLSRTRSRGWEQLERFMEAMTSLRRQRGELITLQSMRYIDVDALAALEQETQARFLEVSAACAEFLLRDEAFGPLEEQLEALGGSIQELKRSLELPPLAEQLETLGDGLKLLTELVGELQVEDVESKTRILGKISETISLQNRTRSLLQSKRESLRVSEGRAEFAAQIQLLTQALASALASAESPESCDDERARLTLQLEELDARFGEFEEFASELMDQREAISESLETRRQQLLEQRQRRIGSLQAAGQRILGGVKRRCASFQSETDLNAWFAGDPMVLKVRQLAEQLSELGDSVKAEELLGRLKSLRQEGLRRLRDRRDLFVDGEDLIQFGRHRFPVNRQALELSIVPVGEEQALHLSGTDYYEIITDEEFLSTRSCWERSLISEDKEVYRSEYLAAELLAEAETGRGRWGLEELKQRALQSEDLLTLIQDELGLRREEGYARGVHDHDAVLILSRLLEMYENAGMLRYPSSARALAWLYWLGREESERERLHQHALSLGRLREALGDGRPLGRLGGEIAQSIQSWAAGRGLEGEPQLAGAYLAEELTARSLQFTVSIDAEALKEGLVRFLATSRSQLEQELSALGSRLDAQLELSRAWLDAVARAVPGREHAVYEASALLIAEGSFRFAASSTTVSAELTGLLGTHPRIHEGKMSLRLDEFLARLSEFRGPKRADWTRYRAARARILKDARASFQLDQFQARVLSSFVRNRLINEVYLPLVGDNLAKQMGAAGEGKRTDLMGMLLLISPPGYGKTTLMEYISQQLGLVFVKINCPSIGHSVHSLDPQEASSATARKEVEKINLAFEMGNNVMLYLDDVQHTHPEFLQKFISLCDGQRRAEGVWRGQTRSYDLKGKKFCIIMAGNPYTETGEKFQIPDMLANRADTYNLGDILGGREEAFALSYIENSLTSNPTLQPLSSRSQSDLYRLIRMAQGEPVPQSELEHGYSAAELQEILTVLRMLGRVRDVLLQVNLQYIASAAQADAYRTEPPFKLQGSYRNMNKITEKVVPAMNEAELEALISDHYAGESQTLTTGAESNLLKLAELRGSMTDSQRARWEAICADFARLKMMGGDEEDPISRVTGTLSALSQHLEGVRDSLKSPKTPEAILQLGERLGALQPAESQDWSFLEGALGELSDSLRERISPISSGAAEPRLASMSVDLHPVVEALEQLREAVLSDRDPSSPTSIPPVQSPAPTLLPSWQRAMLSALSEALEGQAPPTGQGESGPLGQALPILRDLGVALGGLTETLPPAQRELFLQGLREHLASSLGRLASMSGDEPEA